ncbi:toll/interleukin-1 receptor domain-containing adapter protein [Oncorhynchus mykiss]|uniref:Toll-interleukin 1 receptor (TIR) domain containing adaptor protein n=1 Tax=Oncorhynchus mykiss TaxID=8022 RepID=A0A8C7V4L6_ONCMY|nr:toll/interleukin-1 receptor domain-containing adapter protein [Oncorhynchus mykiss]
MFYVINSVKCLVCIQSSTSIKRKKSNAKDITVQFFLLEVQHCNSLENDVKSMYGWFRRLLVKKESPQSSSSPHVQVRTPSPSVDGASSLVPTSTPNPPPPFLSSMIRWSQTYDLCVCHSPVDIEEAIRLATYLEKPACGLRCFLRQRDASVGGAIPTELCQAVQNSHCWALLITPNFLLDDWCQYMMHQALSEGPMSNRIIPLVLNLSYSQYPKELRFYYYKDLSKNPERGYTQVYKTVLKYLEDMDEKDAAKVDCNMHSTSNRLEGASCFPRTKLSSNYQNSEPLLSLQEIERTEAADS